MHTRGCTGEFRVDTGKWTAPRGLTPYDCTLCEWCVAHGCMALEAGFTEWRNLARCSCDCPLKGTHATIQPYNCGAHAHLLGDCAMGACHACRVPCSTPSGAIRYCRACSACRGVCEVCGVDASGAHPFARVAKMLSRENGRGGTHM